MARRTPLAVAASALAALLVLSGCGGPTLGDMPLPGTGVSGETMLLRVDFDEALNLAQGATVKVNGVDSGRVQGVGVADFRAQAEMLVRTDAELRDGATARLRYNTPLGELFVDINNPGKGPLLPDGALITTERSTTAPTVEDALAQASLLVNGGGLAQLQTVTEELNHVVGGREDTVKQLLDRSNRFLVEANATSRDIDQALRALADVGALLESRRTTINEAVRDIRPAARVLRRRTDDLTTLLAEVEKFAATANDTVGRTREQILTVLRQLEPVLAEFVSNGDRFGVSLVQLVRAGTALDAFVPGDYLNIRLDLALDQLSPADPTGDGADADGDSGGDDGGVLPDLPGIPDLPLLGGGR